MSRRLPQLLVALVAFFGAVAIFITVRGADEPPSTSDDPASTVTRSSDPIDDPADAGAPQQPATTVAELSPVEAARGASIDFLDTYVEDDGRVRRDPDGDTVSEGQAYAMLLAVAVDDATTFDRVWEWTQANLLRQDGTLAWRWVDGTVVDPNAATDADLDAGRALLLAAEAFDRPEYRDDAIALGNALLTEGVVDTALGPVLVAGPWATTQPHYVNPSYFSDVAFEQFAAATGDPRWQQLADTSNELLGELTQDGALLPSDWALVDPDGSITPSAPPGGEIAAYGYEAFRVVLRLSEACDDDARALAAALASPSLRTVEEPSDTAGLDGSPMTAGENQLFALAAAAGAQSAGDPDLVDQLLEQADVAVAESPSYFLGAWVALTRVLLDTDALGGCATTPPGEPITGTPEIADPNGDVTSGASTPITIPS